ncbi:UNVERIFIED_CONTAM: hypothetical protein GTU68_004548 [Idotea baltica]|nr:hypothetical protein [Idotea baltica]
MDIERHDQWRRKRHGVSQTESVLAG